MHAQTSSTTTTPTTTSTPTALWAGFRWLSVAVSLGIFIMAMLIGQGVWGGERGLVTGHGHLGNALFVLAIAQLVIGIVLYQRKAMSPVLMVLSFTVLVLLFAQAGLGYSGRNNMELISWHVPLGVLIMGVSSFTTAFAWRSPAPASTNG